MARLYLSFSIFHGVIFAAGWFIALSHVAHTPRLAYAALPFPTLRSIRSLVWG